MRIRNFIDEIFPRRCVLTEDGRAGRTERPWPLPASPCSASAPHPLRQPSRARALASTVGCGLSTYLLLFAFVHAGCAHGCAQHIPLNAMSACAQVSLPSSGPRRTGTIRELADRLRRRSHHSAGQEGRPQPSSTHRAAHATDMIKLAGLWT
jgi:hypothetical protein